MGTGSSRASSVSSSQRLRPRTAPPDSAPAKSSPRL
uniref:EMB2656 (EMBRYO DEFECTIVE 2656) n=1 Tax=Arundo donax TaxID=35708 RepID=A0A0A9GVS9_ARUDO